MTQTFERSNAQSNISDHSQSTYEYPYSRCVSYETLEREGQRDPSFLEVEVTIFPEMNSFRVGQPMTSEQLSTVALTRKANSTTRIVANRVAS
ncbi:hypothetical protein EON76_05700 [bacterium]|nr:MAG: hypothetical protein EON76_05700 [bacterium]